MAAAGKPNSTAERDTKTPKQTPTGPGRPRILVASILTRLKAGPKVRKELIPEKAVQAAIGFPESVLAWGRPVFF